MTCVLLPPQLLKCTTGMATPEEVQDNVDVMVEMSRRPVLDLAPLGEIEDEVQPAEQQCSFRLRGVGGDVGGWSANMKAGVAAGLTGAPQCVLQKIRLRLQPVKDVDWPVGLTDNRK